MTSPMFSESEFDTPHLLSCSGPGPPEAHRATLTPHSLVRVEGPVKPSRKHKVKKVTPALALPSHPSRATSSHASSPRRRRAQFDRRHSAALPSTPPGYGPPPRVIQSPHEPQLSVKSALPAYKTRQPIDLLRRHASRSTIFVSSHADRPGSPVPREPGQGSSIPARSISSRLSRTPR